MMSFKVKDGSQKATGATASDAVKQLEKSHGKKVVVMELIPGTNNSEEVTLSQQEIESR
jgi:C-terminal processing protease CtpA/Prc